MNNLLISFFRSGTSATQDKELLKWLEESPENLDSYINLRALHFRAAENELTANQEAIALHRLHRAMNRLERPRRAWMPFAIAAAAAVLLMIPALLSHPGNTDAEYVCRNDDETTMQMSLPDGSSVMLSPGSLLSYNAGTFAESRDIRLEGEAFFDVAKDAEHPFTLSMPLMKVKVLGTSFNARNYPGDSYAETTLAEGSVLIMDGDGNGLARLRPGQSARYDAEEGALDVSDATTEDIVYMRYGIVTLKDLPLKDVLEKVGEMFNAKLTLASPEKGRGPYTVKFTKDGDIKDVVKLIETVSGCSIVIA